MPAPDRGEVGVDDLGTVAKIRPCLVLSIPADPQDRAPVALVANPTSTRGPRFEVAIPTRFVQAGAFDARNLVTVPEAKLIRRLGLLAPDPRDSVEDAVRRWSGLSETIREAGCSAPEGRHPVTWGGKPLDHFSPGGAASCSLGRQPQDHVAWGVSPWTILAPKGRHPVAWGVSPRTMIPRDRA